MDREPIGHNTGGDYQSPEGRKGRLKHNRHGKVQLPWLDHPGKLANIKLILDNLPRHLHWPDILFHPHGPLLSTPKIWIFLRIRRQKWHRLSRRSPKKAYHLCFLRRLDCGRIRSRGRGHFQSSFNRDGRAPQSVFRHRHVHDNVLDWSLLYHLHDRRHDQYPLRAMDHHVVSNRNRCGTHAA